MNIGPPHRLVCALAMLGALVVGCGPHPPSVDQEPAAVTSGVASRIDPRWMDVHDTDGTWEVLTRDITPDRQSLSLKPSDETYDFPHECPVCNHPPATAFLTLYDRAAYDPAAVRTGQRVMVNGGEGFFLPPRWPAGAVLAWEYGENAWATARGVTRTTGNVERLLQLAAQVRAAERTPVRLPLSLRTLPADMPLSSVDLWGSRRQTTVSFDGCGGGKFQTRVALCTRASDTLTIRLTRDDEFPSFRDEGGRRREVYTIPVSIGDRTGYVHEDRDTEAAIKVAPGVVVTFELLGPVAPGGSTSAAPSTRLADVLAGVVWTPHPGDESTWPAIAEWTK